MTTEEQNLTSLIKKMEKMETVFRERIDILWESENPASQRLAVTELGRLIRHGREIFYDELHNITPRSYNLTEEQLDSIKSLKEKHLSPSEIAKELKLTRIEVFHGLGKIEETKND